MGRGEGEKGAQVIDRPQHASHISADVLTDPIKPEYIKDVVSLARTHPGGFQVGGKGASHPRLHVGGKGVSHLLFAQDPPRVM